MPLSDQDLLQAAQAGDQQSLNELFARYRDKLKKLVESRLDLRLATRVDGSDVVQEVHLEVVKRLPEYLANPTISFYHWMRFLTKQKMAELVRRHIHAQARDVRREQQVSPRTAGDSTRVLVGFLLDAMESPSELVGQNEMHRLINDAIDQMVEQDREVLVLRHVEQLSTSDAAVRLGISENTCRQRHLRALKRLRSMLKQRGLDW